MDQASRSLLIKARFCSKEQKTGAAEEIGDLKKKSLLGNRKPRFTKEIVALLEKSSLGKINYRPDKRDRRFEIKSKALQN